MLMKNMWLLAALLGCWPGPAVAQSTDELVNDGKNPENVTTQSMGYDRKSYSPLKQINASTVKRLVPIWSTSLMNDMGELAAPTIYNGVMYVINGKWTFAIDVETGRQIWRTPVQIQPGVQRAAITRGAATIYNGRLFRVTNDNHLLALDMKTGKEIWNQKFAEAKEGYYATSAPIVANGVLISGMAGGESTTRGFLIGWDPETGQKLWTRYTIPAPGEPGSETWPKNSDAWKVGGGPTWRSGAYDPQLDLVYWGVGNAEPYDPRPREALDSLYTSSVLAIRPKTGEIAWHYQFTPNDAYDYDACWELIVADIKVQGRSRKVVMQLNRNGFLYVLDRANGELISAKAYEKVNWASHVDMKTGRPVETEIAKSIRDMKATEHWPSTRGAKNWQHAAYNPRTGLLYANTFHEGRMYKLLETQAYVVGQRYMFIENLPLPRAADQPIGHIEAIDPLTAEKKWRVPLMDFQIWSAMLASGELLFTGKETGEFIALDAATGKQLWQFQTGSGINAMPVTYTYKDRQYVTVLSGIGGLYWNINRERLKDKVPQGGSVWTFALLPD